MDLPIKIYGITWHAVVTDNFTQTKELMIKQFDNLPAIDREGFAMFDMSNGTSLELFAPANVPAYGFNEGMAFGFSVENIDEAVQALLAAGYKMLNEIVRLEQMEYAGPYYKSRGIDYAYCHFKGKDGRVYGLNQQRPLDQTG